MLLSKFFSLLCATILVGHADSHRFLRFRALKPGGWVENQEFSHHRRSDDNTIPPDSRMSYWEREWSRGISQVGLAGKSDLNLIAEQMGQAGFINIKKLEFKLPVGPWPKDERLKQAGAFVLVTMLEGMHGLSVKIFEGILGWSSAELEILMLECRTELKKKSIHAYWPMSVLIIWTSHHLKADSWQLCCLWTKASRATHIMTGEIGLDRSE